MWYTCMQKNLEKFNLNEEKKSGSWVGYWTRDSSNFSKAIWIWPKRYNPLATQTLVQKCSELENWLILNWILLLKGSKIHFWPLSSDMRQIGPIPSWSFWKNATFLLRALWVAVGCSLSKLGFLALFLKPLD